MTVCVREGRPPLESFPCILGDLDPLPPPDSAVLGKARQSTANVTLGTKLTTTVVVADDTAVSPYHSLAILTDISYLYLRRRYMPAFSVTCIYYKGLLNAGLS